MASFNKCKNVSYEWQITLNARVTTTNLKRVNGISQIANNALSIL